MRHERNATVGKWRAKGYAYGSQEGRFIWLSFSFNATARGVSAHIGIAGAGVGFNLWKPT